MAEAGLAQRLRAEVAGLSAVRPGSRALRLAVLELLAPVISFDAHVFVLTDPSTAVGADPVATVPPTCRLSDLIRAKYLTRANRWTRLIGARPPASTMQAVRGQDRVAAEPWWSVAAGAGALDLASVVFADQYGCWGFLDLWRTAGSPFDEHAVEVLGQIAGPVATALRQAQARTFAEPPREPRPVEPAVVIVGDDLVIRGSTGASMPWLDGLLPPAVGARAVPASVYNVAAALLAAEANVAKGPASARVHLADGLWLTVRAARLSRTAAETPIAVSIEPCSGAERLDLLARSHALTPRERELVERLRSGADTRELAAQMRVTESTVQDHLKAIFTKTETQSRLQLMGRISGRSYE